MDWIQVLAIIALLLLVPCLKLVVARSRRSIKKVARAEYRRRGPLLSPAERSFYGVLK